MEITADGKRATLKIEGAYTAEELENLIVRLGGLRAHMTPPVPFTPPITADHDRIVSEQTDPYIASGLLRDGGLRVWLRNYGLGWMMFTVSAENVIALRDYLMANTPHPKHGPDLFGPESGSHGDPI